MFHFVGVLTIWYVFTLAHCSFGLPTFQMRFNSRVRPAAPGAPGSPQLPCSLRGFPSSPACRLSFWRDVAPSQLTCQVPPSRGTTGGKTGGGLQRRENRAADLWRQARAPSALSPLLDTTCICTHFQPLKVLDPEPEPEPEPHPQGLFCDCRPGLPFFAVWVWMRQAAARLTAS